LTNIELINLKKSSSSSASSSFSSNVDDEPLVSVILFLNESLWVLFDRVSLTRTEKDVMTTTWFALCNVYSV
jgi:hypothetical protein